MSSYRPLRFLDASARADEIVANDKLGIGTHSQTSELHIKADAPEVRIQDEVSAVTETALRITANSGVVSFQSGVDFTDDSKGDFEFASMGGDTVHMSIDGSTGRVGVGTTSPAALLDVKAVKGITTAATTSDLLSNATIRISGYSDNNDALCIGMLSTSSSDTGNNPYAYIQNIWDLSTAKPLLLNPAGGYVGIGTTNPSADIHISGSDPVLKITDTTTGDGAASLWLQENDSYGVQLKYKSSGNDFFNLNIVDGGTETTRMVVDRNGNVGIGTVSPGYKLHVEDSTNPRIMLENTDTELVQNQDIGSILFKQNDVTTTGTGIIGKIRMSSVIAPDRGTFYGESANMIFSVGQFADDNANIDALTIRGDGNVGIGNTTAYCPLQVTGGGGNVGQGTYWRFLAWHGLNNSNNTNDPWGAVTISANGLIHTRDAFLAANGTLGASDRRIKTNITDLDDGECLELLRQLNPKKYNYRDTTKSGSEPVYGFIAQEVRDVLPYATRLRTDYIANIYEVANVSQSNVITFTDFNTSQLEGGTSIIRIIDIDNEDHDIHLAEVIDEHTIRVEEDLSQWTKGFGNGDEEFVEGNQLFIYGERVNDFCYLKKEAIWTVATSALQEVDRQLQAEKAKVAALEARLSALEALVQQP